eukprot:11114627-Alexandrium_andersonii.AAC.1
MGGCWWGQRLGGLPHQVAVSSAPMRANNRPTPLLRSLLVLKCQAFERILKPARQSDSQTVRQSGSQTARQPDSQTGRQSGSQTVRQSG